MGRTRQLNQRVPTQRPVQKPAQTRARPRRWWKKGDKFTVEYIESATSFKPENAPARWLYDTKWYLYSRRENTMETAATFAECEYPILERFWGSVGKAIPEGTTEPDQDPEPANGTYDVFYSTEQYRRREASITLKMDREDDTLEDPDEPEETVGSVGQVLENNTEVAASLMIDSLSHLALDRETMPLPSAGEPDLFLPTDSSSTSSCTTDSETSSVYEPEVTPPPVIHTRPMEKGRFSLPVNGTVAPLDTIIIPPKRPTHLFISGRGFKTPRPSSAAKYSSLRPGNTAGVSSNFIGGDFRSTPSISLRDKEAMPFRRYTYSARTPMTRPQRMQYYRMEYTKAVNKRMRECLDQPPPGMQLADWDGVTVAASSQADTAVADALYEEFVEDAPLKTLKEFTIQDLDTDIIS